MFIFIPSTKYAATAEGSVIKEVTCENCGHVYSYRMSRIVGGTEKSYFSSSRGPAKALLNARANLAKALDTEHDDVPCPECKWHQSSHVAYVRSQSYEQLKSLAGAFFIFARVALGVVLFFLGLCPLLIPGLGMPRASSMAFCALVVLAVASPGFLLLGLRRLAALTYRPNRQAGHD